MQVEFHAKDHQFGKLQEELVTSISIRELMKCRIKS